MVAPIPSTFYVGMNFHRPPFDDRRVREALNFAIDRDRLVALLGGPSRVRLTCQILRRTSRVTSRSVPTPSSRTAGHGRPRTCNEPRD